MADAHRLREALFRRLRCAISQPALRVNPAILQCVNASRGVNFAVIDNCPILLNEPTSFLSFDDFRQRRDLYTST
jgi:hypothetical protein